MIISEQYMVLRKKGKTGEGGTNVQVATMGLLDGYAVSRTARYVSCVETRAKFGQKSAEQPC